MIFRVMPTVFMTENGENEALLILLISQPETLRGALHLSPGFRLWKHGRNTGYKNHFTKNMKPNLNAFFLDTQNLQLGNTALKRTQRRLK